MEGIIDEDNDEIQIDDINILIFDNKRNEVDTVTEYINQNILKVINQGLILLLTFKNQEELNKFINL